MSQWVEASLNYALPSSEELWTRIYRPPPPAPWTNVQNDTHIVQIHNARGREDKFSLDQNGFEFIQHTSAVRDLFDEAVIRKQYYPEIMQLVRGRTGAQRVFIAGHMHRRSHGFESKATFNDVTGPAYAVHGDRTMDAVQDIMIDGFSDTPYTRFRIINVWRPIGTAAYDVPLAVLDSRSVDVERDLVKVAMKYNTYDINTLAAFYKPDHMWYYLKDQAPQEAILMKNYDSLTDGTARFCMHTAFLDPTCPPNAPCRRSIEVRAYVLD